MPYSRGVSEGSILFYNGGHNHNGTSSALIATEAYSIYDFIVGFAGSNERQIKQQTNFNNLKTVISNVIKTDVLGPSGIRLLPNSIQSIHISAGSITADELSANLVLVNNIISSSNFNGTVAANGVITGQGSSGWAITSSGDAVFSNTAIRGTLTAGAVYINAYNQWYANGTIYVGNPQFQQPGFSYDPALGMSVRGSITATSGKIGDFDITNGSLITAGFLGWIALGPIPNAAYGGVEAGEVAVATRDPADNHDVRATMRGQRIMIEDQDNPAFTTYMHKNGFATNGVVACDSVQTPSVVYPYSANQIAFSWDGSVLSAVVDGVAFPLSTGAGTPAVTPAVTPATTPATTPAVSPGACVECSTPGTADCCPPATCGSFKDGFICLDLSNM